MLIKKHLGDEDEEPEGGEGHKHVHHLPVGPQACKHNFSKNALKSSNSQFNKKSKTWYTGLDRIL